jgi:hypothetical protein
MVAAAAHGDEISSVLGSYVGIDRLVLTITGGCIRRSVMTWFPSNSVSYGMSDLDRGWCGY